MNTRPQGNQKEVTTHSAQGRPNRSHQSPSHSASIIERHSQHLQRWDGDMKLSEQRGDGLQKKELPRGTTTTQCNRRGEQKENEEKHS